MAETKPVERRFSLKHWRQIGGLVLGLVLLAIVIASASLPDIVRALRTVDLRLIVVAYALNLLMLALMAYRWYRLHAISSEVRPPYLQTLSVSFMGVFFSNFLPSVIGGDAYRTYHMSRARPDEGVSSALSIVFVDRVIGLLGMALVGSAALMLGFNRLELPPAIIVWIGALFLLLSAGLFLSMNRRFHRFVLGMLARLFGRRSTWLNERLGRLFEKLAYFAGRRDLLREAVVISVVLRLVWIFGCYLTGLALAIDLSLLTFLVAIPLIELIRMIPITLQGIGVREALFVLFFQQYGVSAADATTLAILIYTLLNLNGIVGGVLFLLKLKQARHWASR